MSILVLYDLLLFDAPYLKFAQFCTNNNTVFNNLEKGCRLLVVLELVCQDSSPGFEVNVTYYCKFFSEVCSTEDGA